MARTISFHVLPTFQVRRANLVVIFVRGRKPGDSVLAGVRGRRTTREAGLAAPPLRFRPRRPSTIRNGPFPISFLAFADEALAALVARAEWLVRLGPGAN